MDAEPKHATAFHEAGHAVVAMALGRPVEFISILADREYAGMCEFGKGVFRPTEDWLEREILISLGGIAAEAKFTGNYAWDGAARDSRYVLKLAAQRVGEKQAERLQKRMLAKVENLLNKASHWRAVEKIAQELLARGEMSGRAAKHHFERECAED